MNISTVFVNFVYLVAAVLFMLGIKRLSSPTTARSGNLLGSLGMLVAVVVTLLHYQVLNPGLILGGIVIGALIGAVMAQTIKMTAMPQLVAVFNGLGGGASALIVAAEFARVFPTGAPLTVDVSITMAFSAIVGAVTLSGSLLAFAKLQGLIKGSPVTFPLQQPLNMVLFVVVVVLTGVLVVTPSTTTFSLLLILPLILGVVVVVRIGGADMPVVISLLNSLSGLAAAATGFVIGNTILIIAGTLVGAAGLILTQIMSKAMNRSLTSVLFGGFGAQPTGADSVPGAGSEGVARSVTAEDAATVLAYASSVIIVPGYGLAVAQAQHNIAELDALLEKRGTTVKYAIHPVAGRMPGHMNVLLAEANVPYTKLFDLDDINSQFQRADVAIVIGANDVTNPAARDVADSPLYGMPILNVDQARSVLVLKRSLSPGFAGIDNQLFYDEKTMMLFGDAKESAISLTGEVKNL